MTITIKQEELLVEDLKKVVTDSRKEIVHNEQVLFLCVILQALLDATKPEENNESVEARLARSSAKAWFSASIGVTAQDFRDVCDLARVDSSYVKSFAYKVITEKSIPFIRKRINTLLTFE